MASSGHSWIEALLDPRAYPHPTGKIELVETHISWVLLTGEFAYKVKKPVKFPFVDFSTLALRRRCCRDELLLNRRLAPELYLDVVPIGGTHESPHIGETPAIEYAVKMRQFPSEQTLDVWLDHAPAARQAFRAFAERIAAFHAEIAATKGKPVERAVLQNLEELHAALDRDTRLRLEPIAAWSRDRSKQLEPRLRRREMHGAIRDCHGDLHLGNLVWLEDRIVAFDCLEFNDTLRSIDTIDEVAFLVMDLMARGRADLGFEFVNRYLEVCGDYDGVGLLRYYLIYRALVRSKVRALAAAQHVDPHNTASSTPYLDLATQLTARASPTLVITHGLSGSGKTTVTNELVGRLPAIRVRSDLERKRLHGLEPLQRSESDLDRGLYTASASGATYAALARAAEAVLESGFNVIVDATFLERPRRDAFAGIAQHHGAQFVVLGCTASDTELRQRVARREARNDDPSEAGLAVLEHQLERAGGLEANEPGRWISVDTSSAVDADRLVREVLGAARYTTDS